MYQRKHFPFEQWSAFYQTLPITLHSNRILEIIESYIILLFCYLQISFNNYRQDNLFSNEIQFIYQWHYLQTKDNLCEVLDLTLHNIVQQKYLDPSEFWIYVMVVYHVKLKFLNSEGF